MDLKRTWNFALFSLANSGIRGGLTGGRNVFFRRAAVEDFVFFFRALFFFSPGAEIPRHTPERVLLALQD